MLKIERATIDLNLVATRTANGNLKLGISIFGTGINGEGCAKLEDTSVQRITIELTAITPIDLEDWDKVNKTKVYNVLEPPFLVSELVSDIEPPFLTKNEDIEARQGTASKVRGVRASNKVRDSRRGADKGPGGPKGRI